jgi:hypothetical protein
MITVSKNIGQFTFNMPEQVLGIANQTSNLRLLITRDGTGAKIGLYQGIDGDKPNTVTFLVDDDFANAKHGYYHAEIQHCGKTVFKERVYMSRTKYSFDSTQDYMPVGDVCLNTEVCEMVEKKCGCCNPCACQSTGILESYHVDAPIAFEQDCCSGVKLCS